MTDNTERVPSLKEINALGSIIPLGAGTVAFDHELLLLTSPDGSLRAIRDFMIPWGPVGEIDRVRRTITITISDAVVIEHVASNDGKEAVTF